MREMADVSRAGLEAAMTVVERMLDFGRQTARAPFPFPLPAERIDGRNGDGTDPEPDQGRELRRLRADAERQLELWGESMRVLLDLAADAAETSLDGRDKAMDGISLGPVRPGAVAFGRAWLHVLDGPPGPPAHLTATAFTSHDSTVIEARCASFTPPVLDSFALRSSQEVQITIEVPSGTPPGTYRGHILARGLSEVGLAVRLDVAE
jgi:hypothetical protein